MFKKQILDKLIKIADQLDNNGQGLEADELDGVISEISGEMPETEVEIPENEKLLLEDVFRALSDSLGKTSVTN